LEGTHTDAEIAGLRKHLEQAGAQSLIDVFRFARRQLYVNSWRSGATESLAMWDLYGKGSGIVAVKSTVRRLKEAVAKCDNPIYISRIEYVDWDDAPGLDNVLVASSRKELGYQHESEVRAIVMEVSSAAEPQRKLGIKLPVDIERLITEIIVGPREQKWVLGLAERVMKRYGLPQKVTASNRLTPRG
jgi:hypothetical protein